MSPVRLLIGSLLVYSAVVLMHGCDSGHGVMSTYMARSVGAGGAASAGHGGAGPSAGALMDPAPNADAEESGSRLKALWRVGDDGSRGPFFLWYDSQRKERCSFLTMADGRERCAPVTSGAGVSGYYTDVSCFKLAALVSPSPCPMVEPKYAMMYDSSICPAGYRVYSVAGPVSEVYQKSSSGECTLATFPLGYGFYGVGPEIPPTEFVGAAVVQDP